MKEFDKCTQQTDVDKDHLINQFNSTKKSPYIFLILIAFPFVVYLLPTNYLEVQHMWTTILVMLFVNSQADSYVLNKKLKILSKILEKN